MFTGLIQTLGTLHPLGSQDFKILCAGDRAHTILADMELGDSIAVDGVCLTVAQCLANGFIANASPETLAKTTLGQREPGAVVNLESSLRVGSKLGGHFVTGHIDGQGYLEQAEVTDNAWNMAFTVADRAVMAYIISKGSIAINGVSLTVAKCSDRGDWFEVAVIPVTYQETNLSCLEPGQTVNLEGDILGKYVEKLLAVQPYARRGGHSDLDADLTSDFLADHGYL